MGGVGWGGWGLSEINGSCWLLASWQVCRRRIDQGHYWGLVGYLRSSCLSGWCLAKLGWICNVLQLGVHYFLRWCCRCIRKGNFSRCCRGIRNHITLRDNSLSKDWRWTLVESMVSHRGGYSGRFSKRLLRLIFWVFVEDSSWFQKAREVKIFWD